ncbi:MAG TPA: nitrilase-related carbon-nitrogen hydrolase [Pontimonas sp.]|nr:nitrilase-related carbon-nitrogen hydrolase [Pontimonas sp.]
MAALGLTLAQYAPRGSIADNVSAMGPLVSAAAQAGSQLVVFPEYSHAFTSGLGAEWAGTAESLEGVFVAGLTRLSQDNGGIVIIAGMLVADSSGDLPANTQVAVGDSGVLAQAEKIHLYDAFGASESAWIRPGSADAPELFVLQGLHIGMMACYDLRFPEVSRRLVDAGADVIVTPAQWVPGDTKAHHFETLLAARAIETQTFVLASDHPEPWGIGLSQVVDPRGLVVARAGAGEELIHAVLDPELLAGVRKENPMAGARRFGVTPL